MKKTKLTGVDIMEHVTLIRTNRGLGFKVVINGKWFYTNEYNLYDLIEGKRKSVVFNTRN